MPLPQKKQVMTHCLTKITERIQACQEALQEMQEASGEETKSSAGDKYETAREMLQQERSKYATQLQQALREREVLLQIPKEKATQVVPGALLQTSWGIFFLGISLGQVCVEGQTVTCISSEAPITQILKTLQVGGSTDFRGRSLTLEAII
jgi:superfamily II RNA helicase